MPAEDGHFGPDQGAAVLALLRQADGILNEVFVITPPAPAPSTGPQ